MRACIFTIRNEAWAVPLTRVLELRRAKGLTRVPRAPSWVHGVVHCRGRIAPVVSLTAGEVTEEEDLLVMEAERSAVALPVHEVKGLIDLELFPEDDMGVRRARAPSLAQDVVLLDLDRLVDLWSMEARRELETAREPNFYDKGGSSPNE